MKLSQYTEDPDYYVSSKNKTSLRQAWIKKNRQHWKKKKKKELQREYSSSSSSDNAECDMEYNMENVQYKIPFNYKWDENLFEMYGLTQILTRGTFYCMFPQSHFHDMILRILIALTVFCHVIYCIIFKI